MSNRQFVAVQFNPWDRRTYTYHFDGEPLLSGEKVIVETKRGEAVVTVVAISDQQPNFETKPILRKAPPKEEDDVPAFIADGEVGA